MADEDVVVGTGPDGADPPSDDPVDRFKADLRDRQEALWAVVVHGGVRIDGQIWDGWTDAGGENHDYLKSAREVVVYLPRTLGALDVERWLDDNYDEAYDALQRSAAEVARCDSVRVEWIVPVPGELSQFLAQNTRRPMPRRYNSTAVQYFERDGIAWLTHPERKLYDALREEGRWVFIPQPHFVLPRDLIVTPDFLILWNGRPDQGVVLEIDSDRWHRLPSQRRDEERNAFFQARGFAVLHYSAQQCEEPHQVLQVVWQFCSGRWRG